MEDLSKGFRLKKAYATSRREISNTKNAYNDLVLGNKTIGDVFHKTVDKELSKNDKTIFQNAKKLFNLRIESYEKSISEEKNLKPEKKDWGKSKIKKTKVWFVWIPQRKKDLTIFYSRLMKSKNI